MSLVSLPAQLERELRMLDDKEREVYLRELPLILHKVRDLGYLTVGIELVHSKSVLFTMKFNNDIIVFLEVYVIPEEQAFVSIYFNKMRTRSISGTVDALIPIIKEKVATP